jgi:hypothetical protein
LALYIQAFFYGLIGFRLKNPHSQRRSCLSFFVSRACRRQRDANITYDFDEIRDLEQDRETNNQPVYDYDTLLEDSSAQAERNFIYNLNKSEYHKYPLIIKDFRKVLTKKCDEEVICRNLSLHLRKGEILTLLDYHPQNNHSLNSIL